MSNQDYLYLQEAKEEADFLRKRAWDFIDKLEKMQRERKNSTDANKRKQLQIRIDNTHRLLDDYKIQYKNICNEAGIPQDSLSISAKSGDIVSSTSEKTKQTKEEIETGNKKIELAPFFALVPPRNPKFTGREDNVRDFIKRVLEGGSFSICGVKGMGGIGKTEIAKEVCHLFHETWGNNPQIPEYVSDLLLVDNKDGFFTDGILWIQFEAEKQTPQIVIEYIIPMLTDSQRVIDKITDLDILANTLEGKKVLIVLDSVEQNLRVFDYALERFKGKFPIIITSRIAIPGIQAIDIDVLTDKEANSLFISSLQNSDKLSDKQTKLIAELCEILGNYPLIIERIAGLIDSEKSNLEQIKNDYKENRTALLEASTDNTDIDTRHIDAKTCFTMSLNSLSDIEKNAFLHSSFFSNPFTVSALATLIRSEDKAEVQQMITHLLRLSLISQSKNKKEHTLTYYLHPLMREFALDLLMKQVKIIDNKKEKIADLLKYLKGLEEKNILFEYLKNDRSIVAQATEVMEYCDRIFEFSTVRYFMNILNNPINSLGYWDEKIYLNKLTIRAAVGLQFQSSEAFWLEQLAHTLDEKSVSSNEYKYNYKIWRSALFIRQDLNENNNVLFCKYRITAIHKDLCQWERSFKESYQGIREASCTNSVDKMQSFIKSLTQVFNVFHDGRIKKLAKISFKIKTINVQEEWNRQNFLFAYNDIIDTKHSTGEYFQCIKYYKKQLNISKKMEHKAFIASSTENLFYSYLYSNDHKNCQFYLKKYLQLSNSLGYPESDRQEKIGKFDWLTGSYSSAIKHFNLLLKGNNDLKQHEYFYWLGKSHLYQGNLDKASKYLNKALEHQKKQKNSVEVAKVYTQLAFLELKQGQVLQAIDTINLSFNTQYTHNIKISPEEEKIEQAIRERFIEEGGDTKQYKKLAEQAKPIDLTPDFILPELADSYRAKDGKTMQLVPAGSAFIGKGEIENPTTEKLLDNIEQYLYPYQQHSNQYQFEKHPEHRFDKDKVLFLLEQSSTLSEKEKQKIIGNIPTMEEQAINQLINKMEYEYKQANLKATEIYLYPYYMDRDPVSNAEYQIFCLATQPSLPSHWVDGIIPQDTDNLPVVNITLKDAKAYANWAGKEIPTAAEWEKACRGEKGDLYPWGNNWSENKVINKDGNIRKHFEEEYLLLNTTVPKTGGFIHFPSPRFKMPVHNLKISDEKQWISLLEGSISLTIEEKFKIASSITQLTQFQIDELLRILIKEKDEFNALDKKYDEQLNIIRKNHYVELMQAELNNLYKCSFLSFEEYSISNNEEISIREKFEKEYIELNATIPEKGGLIHFPSPRFILPSHNFEIDDEEEWLSLLEGSISLTVEEKIRIIDSFGKLTQFQIDELSRTLREEKDKFMALGNEHDKQLNSMRKKHYVELMQPELRKLYQNTPKAPTKNKSIFGIHDLVGCIYNLTSTEGNGSIVIKGGSWFSENPQESCQAWAEETINSDETNILGDWKRMDTGFRCVKPIFSKEDIEETMLAK